MFWILDPAGFTTVDMLGGLIALSRINLLLLQKKRNGSESPDVWFVLAWVLAPFPPSILVSLAGILSSRTDSALGHRAQHTQRPWTSRLGTH